MVVEKATPARSAKCEKAQVPQGKIIKKLRRLGRIKGQPNAKQNHPPPAGKRQWVAKKKPSASWEKKGSGWPRKNPPTLAGKGDAGSRSARAHAKPKNNTQQRNKMREGGLCQPTTRAEKHTNTKKRR